MNFSTLPDRFKNRPGFVAVAQTDEQKIADLKAECAAFEQHTRKNVQSRIRAGDILGYFWPTIPHGQKGTWLKKHVPSISERQANRLIHLSIVHRQKNLQEMSTEALDLCISEAEEVQIGQMSEMNDSQPVEETEVAETPPARQSHSVPKPSSNGHKPSQPSRNGHTKRSAPAREPGCDDDAYGGKTKIVNPETADLPKSVANALADTWHAECARLLNKMQKEVKSAISWSTWLDGAVLDHLKSAEECFLSAIPRRVCDECGGKKCQRCKHGGFLAAQA